MGLVRESISKKFPLWAFLLLAVILSRQVEAKTLTVGGPLGWTNFDATTSTAPDYSTWASAQTIMVGDVLVFNYAVQLHDVNMLPSKTDFDSCSFVQASVVGAPTAGTYSWTAPAIGSYFFACSFGLEGGASHCQSGQKLAVSVVPAATAPVKSPALAPTPITLVPAPLLAPVAAPIIVPIPVPVVAPAPVNATTPAPAPANTTTPAPAPANATTPAPAPANVTTPAPAPAVVLVPVPAPAVIIPVPTPVPARHVPAPAPAHKAPAHTPRAAPHPSPKPSPKHSPAPAPAPYLGPPAPPSPPAGGYIYPPTTPPTNSPGNGVGTISPMEWRRCLVVIASSIAAVLLIV